MIDRTAPLPRPSGPGTVTPEEAVLAVMIGAVDLGTEEARHAVLAAMAPLAGELRSTYAVFIRRAAPPEALARVEELMTTTYRDTFVEGLLAEGEAKGQAQILLRVLKARHLPVSAARRRQVEECTDTAQLEAWADLAANATSIDQVFGD